MPCTLDRETFEKTQSPGGVLRLEAWRQQWTMAEQAAGGKLPTFLFDNDHWPVEEGGQHHNFPQWFPSLLTDGIVVNMALGRHAVVEEHLSVMGVDAFDDGPDRSPLVDALLSIPRQQAVKIIGNALHVKSWIYWIVYVLSNTCPCQKSLPLEVGAPDSDMEEGASLFDDTVGASDSDAIEKALFGDITGVGNLEAVRHRFRSVKVDVSDTSESEVLSELEFNHGEDEEFDCVAPMVKQKDVAESGDAGDAQADGEAPVVVDTAEAAKADMCDGDIASGASGGEPDGNDNGVASKFGLGDMFVLNLKAGVRQGFGHARETDGVST